MKLITLARAGLVSLSIVISLDALASDTASGPPDEVSFQFPVLLTACQVEKGDKYFEDAPVLVLAFVVSNGTSVLYEHLVDEDKFLAEMHYDEGGLDAQGGLWSMARAGDAYDYLAKKAFFLITSKEDYQSSNYFKKLKPCKIDYVSLTKYLQRR